MVSSGPCVQRRGAHPWARYCIARSLSSAAIGTPVHEAASEMPIDCDEMSSQTVRGGSVPPPVCMHDKWRSLLLDSRVVIGQIWRNRLFLQASPGGRDRCSTFGKSRLISSASVLQKVCKTPESNMSLMENPRPPASLPSIKAAPCRHRKTGSSFSSPTSRPTASKSSRDVYLVWARAKPISGCTSFYPPYKRHSVPSVMPPPAPSMLWRSGSASQRPTRRPWARR